MLHNILMICLLVLLLIRPFICSVAFFQKDLIFEVVTILVCLIWLAQHRLKRELIRQPVFLCSAVFLLCIAMSCIFSTNQLKSLLILPQYFAAVLCFWSVYVMEEKDIRKLIPVLIISAVLVSFQSMLWLWHDSLATLDFFKSQNFYYDFANELISRNRAFIPFILPAALGGFLILVFPLSMGYYVANYKNINVPLFKRPLKNSLLMVPVLFILAALFLTRSLGPILSILMASLIILGSQQAKKNRLLAFLFWLMLCCLALLVCVRSCSTGYWRNPIFSLGQRQLYWQNTFKIIKMFPWQGVGPGNLPFVGSWFSHNSYLQLWAETGVFGLLSFLAFIFACWHNWLKSGGYKDIVCLTIAIAVLGFLIHNLIDFTFFLPEVSVFWWVMLALFCQKRYTYNGVL
jgi:O-antigen ligase